MDSSNMNVDNNFFDFLEKSPETDNDALFLSELEDILTPSISNKEYANENVKLRQEIKKLREDSVEQNSLLVENYKKLSQSMLACDGMKKQVEEWKKTLDCYENEVSGLKQRVGELESANYQFQQLKLLNSADSIENMKKEISKKTSTVGKLRNQMVVQKRKFSENKRLSDGLMKHATCLWGYLLDLGKMLSQVGLWNGIQKRILEKEFMDNIDILGEIRLKDGEDILEALNSIPVVSEKEWDNARQRIVIDVPSLHDSSSNQQEALQKPFVSSSVPSPPLTSPSSCLSSPAVMEEDNSSHLPSNTPDICEEKQARRISSEATNTSEKSRNDSASIGVAKKDESPQKLTVYAPLMEEPKMNFSDCSNNKNSSISEAMESSASMSQKSRNHPDVSNTIVDSKKDSIQVDLKPFEKCESPSAFDDDLITEMNEEIRQLKEAADLVCLSPFPPSPPKKRLRRNSRETSILPSKDSTKTERLASTETIDPNSQKLEFLTDLPVTEAFSCDKSNSQVFTQEDFDHSKDKDDGSECPPNNDPQINTENLPPSGADEFNSSDVNLENEEAERECASSNNVDSCITSNEFNSEDKTNEMLSNETTIGTAPEVPLTNISFKEAKKIAESELNSLREILPEFTSETSSGDKHNFPVNQTKANVASSLPLLISDAPLSFNQVESTPSNSKLSKNPSEFITKDSVVTPKQSIEKLSSTKKAAVNCLKKSTEKTSITVPARVRGRILLKRQLKKEGLESKSDSKEVAPDEVKETSKVSEIAEYSELERPRKLRKEHKPIIKSDNYVMDKIVEMQSDSKEVAPDEVKETSKISEIAEYSELERPRKLRKEHKPIIKSVNYGMDKIVEKQSVSTEIAADTKNGHSNSFAQPESVTTRKTAINSPTAAKKCLRSHKFEKVKKLLNSEENTVLQTRLRNQDLKNSQVNSGKRRRRRKNKKNRTLPQIQNVNQLSQKKPKKKKNKGKLKGKMVDLPIPVSLALEGLQKMRETNLHSLQAENCLYDVLTDPVNVPNSATLLFFVFQFLLTSKYQSILWYVRTNGSSDLIPIEEHCIVRILLKIEESNKPHLQKVLVSAVNSLHQIILSKAHIMLYPLSSLCRVLTLICHQKQSPLKPLSLCCDLLKMKHKYAPYLIASVAGVWKDIFKVSGEMSNEEKIFHCAIAYGAQKNINFNVEQLRKSVEKFLKDFLSAPNVPNIDKIVEFLVNKILLNCTKDLSPDLEYALTSPLIIFAVYGNWSWTKEFLLDKYVIPCLRKFGKTEVNVDAFNIFCKMYVEIFSMAPDGINEEVLTSFFEEGNTLVHDVTAIALMKLHVLQKKKLPSALFEWCEKNQNNPMIPSVEVLLLRKVASERYITRDDIVS